MLPWIEPGSDARQPLRAIGDDVMSPVCGGLSGLVTEARPADPRPLVADGDGGPNMGEFVKLW